LALVSLIIGAFGLVAFVFTLLVAWLLSADTLAKFCVVSTPLFAVSAIGVGRVALPSPGQPGRRTALAGMLLGLFVIIGMIIVLYVVLATQVPTHDD
jgi:hypothetical protein